MSRIAELNQILSTHPELSITHQPSKVSPGIVYLDATLTGVKVIINSVSTKEMF